MLSVRGLTVEVGGTLVVEGAAFTVRAGDRVGLVGPQRRRQDLAAQGAGRHGRAEGRGDPAPGAVRLPAPGPPARPHPARPGHAARPRPRRPRPRRAGRAPRGAAPARWRRSPATSAWSPSGAGPTTRFEHAGGYAAESEARRLLAGLGLRGDRAERPDHRAVGRRAPAGRAGPHPVRRQRPADARRAHQPPRQRRPRLAARLPARLPGRADRHQPRPRAARRVDHPGAAPRPARRGRRRRAHRVQGHVLAVQGRPRARRGPAGQDRRPPADRDRPPADPRRPVGRQGQQGGVRQVARDPHRPHPVRGRRGARRPGAACGSACPTRPRRAAPRSPSTAWPRATATGPRCSTTSTFEVGPGRAPARARASTAPARPACCASSPARPRPTAAASTWGHQVGVGLLRAGARGHPGRRVAARPHGRGRARAARRRCGGGCSACSA